VFSTDVNTLITCLLFQAAFLCKSFRTPPTPTLQRIYLCNALGESVEQASKPHFSCPRHLLSSPLILVFRSFSSPICKSRFAQVAQQRIGRSLLVGSDLSWHAPPHLFQVRGNWLSLKCSLPPPSTRLFTRSERLELMATEAGCVSFEHLLCRFCGVTLRWRQ